MRVSVVWRLGLLSLLWGTEFLFVDVALRETGPFEVTALRLGIAGLFLFAVAALFKERFPRARGFYVHSVVAGLLAIAIPYLFMSLAVERIDSGLVGVFVGASPLMTAALALVLARGERLTVGRLAGLLIGLVGVVVVLQPWNSGEVLLTGALFALGTAFFFALGYVYIHRYLVPFGASDVMSMSVQTFAGAVWLVPLVLLQTSPHVGTTWDGIWPILLLGLVSTGVANVIFFALLRLAGPVTTSIVEYLMVLVALVAGVVILDERLTLVAVLGVVLVVLGVGIAERAGRRDDPVIEAQVPEVR